MLSPRRVTPDVAGLGCLLVLCLAPDRVAAQVGDADSARLERLRTYVVASAPGIAAARAEVAAAEARARGAGTAPPAVLSAEVEEVSDAVDLPDAGSTRIEVSRDFLIGGRGSARRALADADVVSARARLAVQRRQLAARLDQYLAQAAGAAAIAQRLAAEDTLLGIAEDALRVRFGVGEARYVDVLRIRTERLRVATDLATAHAQARIGHRQLRSLVAGEAAPVAAALALADTLIALRAADTTGVTLPPPPDLDSLVRLAGEVRLADAAVGRAHAGLGLARAETRPSLSAGLGIQRFETGDGYAAGPTIGLAVTLPFTAARANHASVQAAEQDVAAARAARDAAAADARAVLGSALERYESARERLTLFGQALLRGVREERESALAAYRAGELSLVELLDFERALARAEITRLESGIEAAEAYAELLMNVTDPEETR